MNIVTKITSTVGALAVCLGGGLLLAPAAHADVVIDDGYAAIGSDTLQDSVNSLANGRPGSPFRVESLNGKRLGNFDAFGSPTIQTKPFAATIARPSGSGAGIKALMDDIVGDKNLVDIARSSRALKADETLVLTSFDFGRDAVSYIYVARDATSAAAVSALTVTELKAVFEASGADYVKAGTKVRGVLPQADSGTRQFFQTVITVPDGTVGDKVVNGLFGGNKIPENDGLVLKNIFDAQPADVGAVVIPFSSASWIAQKNNVAPNRTGTDAKLGAPNGVVPTKGTTTLAPNPAFYDAPSVFGRTTILAAGTNRLSADPQLASLLATTGNPNSLNSDEANEVKELFGFRVS